MAPELLCRVLSAQKWLLRFTMAHLQGDLVALCVQQSCSRLHFSVAGIPLQEPDLFLEPVAADAPQRLEARPLYVLYVSADRAALASRAVSSISQLYS